jgi:hypothetical protein
MWLEMPFSRLRSFSVVVVVVVVVVKSRDSAVGIATSYWLDGRGSIPGRDKRLYPLHSIQTGSGAHPVSYPMGTGWLFPRG